MPALRCSCPRCVGGVIYIYVEDYLRAHEGMADTILESEVAASVQRHPSHVGPRVATMPDGSQILVQHDTAATRPDRWATWGPPVELEADG